MFLLRPLLLVLSLAAFCSAFEIKLDFDEAGNPGVVPSALLKLADAAYDLNMKGLALLDSGKAEASIAWFEKAIDLVPNYADAINNKAVAYWRRGQIGAAQALWAEVLKLDPAYYTAYYNLGIVSYQSKTYADAEKFFAKSVSMNKQFAEALAMLGKARLMQGNTGGAIEALKKAHALNPLNAGAWNTLTHAYLMNGDTALAVELLKKSAGSADACQMLGLLFAQRNHFGESIEWLTKAYQKKQDPDLLYQRAVVQQDSGLFAAALATIRQYLSLAKTPGPDAFNMAAVAARQCGDMAAVKQYLSQGVAKFPDNADLRYNLGQLNFFLKDYAAADKILAELPDTVKDAGVYYSRALIAKSLGKKDIARKFVDKALALDPKAEFYDLLGLLCYEEGKTEDALHQFNKALARNPELFSARLHVGLIEKKGENLDLAITELRKQLAGCSESCGDLALQLATLFYYQNRFDLAAKVLEDLPAADRDARIVRHLAVFYKSLSRNDQAIAVLEDLRKKGKSDSRADYELALAFLETGAWDQAAAILVTLCEKWKPEDARIAYEAAYALSKAGNPAAATLQLERSLKLDPQNRPARSLRAYLLAQNGEDAAARAIWEELSRADGGNAQLFINMGLSYEKQGDYPHALECYRKGLDAEPARSELHVNIAGVLLAQKKPLDAIDSYNQALASPLRSAAAAGLFTAARQAGDAKTAARACDILRKEFPRDVETLRAGSELALDKGDTAAALSALESIAQKNEYDWFAIAGIHAGRGNIEPAAAALAHVPDNEEWKAHKRSVQAVLDFAAGRFEDAVDNLAKSGTGADYVASYNIAVASFNAGKFAVAKKSALSILAIAANDADRSSLLRILGNIAVKDKDWAAALVRFAELADMDRNDAPSAFNAAVAAYNLGKTEQSWDYYERARSKNPALKNADIEARHSAVKEAGGEVKLNTLLAVDSLYNLAVDAQQAGNDTVAEGLYRQVLALNDKHYRSWNNLGAMYGAQGELEKAIDCYKNAVSRKADIADGYANLVNIYIAMDNFGDAEKWLKKGFAAMPGDETLKGMEKRLSEAKKTKE